jgi:hypothetical protein
MSPVPRTITWQVANHTTGLNQTYGWGCESNGQFGDGG